METAKICATKLGYEIKAKFVKTSWSATDENHTIGRKNVFIKKKFLICWNIVFVAFGKTYL